MSVIMQSSERAYYPGCPFSGLFNMPTKTKDMDKYNAESERLTPHAIGNAEPPQHCPGPQQHGHPDVYESHCDHGETGPHAIGNDACAHRRIIYIRLTHEGGTCSDSWECADCKRKFVPAPHPPVGTLQEICDAHNASIERAKADQGNFIWLRDNFCKLKKLYDDQKRELKRLAVKPAAASESWQEIAREAVNRAWNENLIDQNGKTPLKAIIRFAIERSHAAQPQRSEPTPEQMQEIHAAAGEARRRVSKMSCAEKQELEDSAHKRIHGESRRSEQSQEWTAETISIVWNESHGDFFERLSQKHNAELAGNRRDGEFERMILIKDIVGRPMFCYADKTMPSATNRPMSAELINFYRETC